MTTPVRLSQPPSSYEPGRIAVTVLSQPHRKCAPNWKGDHRNKQYWHHKIGNMAEDAVLDALKDVDLPIFPLDGPLAVHITVAWGKHRKIMDEDNAIAACKGLLDGVASGIAVNDRRFRPVTITQGKDVDGMGWTHVVVQATARE